MRWVPIGYLTLGQRLGQTVYNNKFQPIIRRGTIVQEGQKNWLIQNGYQSVFVLDNWAVEDMEPVIFEERHIEGLKLIRQLYSIAKEVLVMEEDLTRVSGNDLFKKRNIRDDALEEVRTWIGAVLGEMIKNRVRYWAYPIVKSAELYGLEHALSTGVLASLIGVKLKMNYKMIEAMFLGSILAEFGNFTIPSSILNKRGRLTAEEFEKVKQHCYKGYLQIKSCSDLDHFVRLICLEHHERIDGSGYPNGLRGEKLNIMAQIVAIADVYDALNSDRAYRPAYTPHKALETIKKGAGSVYDIDIYKVLESIVVPYPIGTIVSLNNGNAAVVEKFKDNDQHKLILRIVTAESDQNMINLADYPTLKIIGIKHAFRN